MLRETEPRPLIFTFANDTLKHRYVLVEDYEALERRNAALARALEQLAECNLTDDNCASLEVATKRIRNIARAALAQEKRDE
jgi:hypothetical protein